METLTEKKAAVKENSGKLSATERTQLEKCEAAILHHFDTFKSAGNALKNIRDSRLYRENFSTFEEYCRDKWTMSKTQANRLISAAGVVENVADVAPPSILEQLSESVVRPLTGLDPKAQRKVMAKIVKEAPPSGKRLTAARVNAVAHEVAPAAFKGRQTKPGKGGINGKSDLIRRSEIVEAIDEWVTARKSRKTFDTLTPENIIKQVKGLIRRL